MTPVIPLPPRGPAVAPNSHRPDEGELDPIVRALTLMTTSDDAKLAGLRSKLADSAEQAGLVDVAYRIYPSPVGDLLLAATAAGVVRIAFETETRDEVLQSLADEISPRVLTGGRRLDRVAGQLDSYFAGTLRRFDVPVDLRLAHGFRAEVLDHLREISYGRTASYGEVARAAGRPAAVRAVGTACARNPVPIVIPCHRVRKSDGSLGGYRGGLAAKEFLLHLESAAS